MEVIISSMTMTHFKCQMSGGSLSRFFIPHFSFFMLLTACVAPASTLTPTPPAPDGVTATPTSVLANSTPAPLPTPDASAQVLRLWLPPQFAPSPETAGGKALLAQLDAFEKAKGWRVVVRVKKAAGQGGLLDALQASAEVAPGVVPDVIALDSSMLASAADSIQPLTQITDGEVVDFYPFALQAARRNDALAALPFAADALGFAYSTAAYPLPPLLWADLKPENGPAWLPLDDPMALVTLQQYVALGGALADAAGQPTIDAGLLAQVLSDYQSMQASGLLPAASSGSMSVEQTWVAYRESHASAAAALFGSYLSDRRRVTATAFTFIPTRSGVHATFARQWNYALVTDDPTRQAIALELMRWLTAPDNLGQWTLASAVLPPRSQALAVWSDASLVFVADQLLSAARPEPPLSALVVVGPPVAVAVRAVLNGQASPETAAAAAAATVAGR